MTSTTSPGGDALLPDTPTPTDPRDPRDPLSQQVAEAFPSRPLTVRRTGYPVPAFLIGLGTFVGALVLGVAVWGGSGIVTDLAVRADPVVVQDAAVDGTCETKRFLTSCDVQIDYTVDGTARSAQPHYFWVGSAHDAEVDVLVARDDPEKVTVSVALEHLTNRVLTLLAGLAIGVVGVVEVARNVRPARATRAAFRSASQLEPVLVRVTRSKPVRAAGVRHRFRFDVDGSPVRREHAVKESKGEVFRVADGRALAVRAPGSASYPVLVDASLQRLDLTDEERSLLDAFRRPAAR